jgi:hypothetical protein
MELYGIEPKNLIGNPYEKALAYKLEGARNRMKELVAEFTRLSKQKPTEENRMAIQRNNHLQSDVYRAIQFTEMLLKELEINDES